MRCIQELPKDFDVLQQAKDEITSSGKRIFVSYKNGQVIVYEPSIRSFIQVQPKELKP